MDTKREISSFIRVICSWVEYEYVKKRHTNFKYDLNNDKLAWIINDKAIEKRIQKELCKRLGLDSIVVYTLLPFEDINLNGELRIRLKENMIDLTKEEERACYNALYNISEDTEVGLYEN